MHRSLCLFLASMLSTACGASSGESTSASDEYLSSTVTNIRYEYKEFAPSEMRSYLIQGSYDRQSAQLTKLVGDANSNSPTISPASDGTKSIIESALATLTAKEIEPVYNAGGPASATDGVALTLYFVSGEKEQTTLLDTSSIYSLPAGLQSLYALFTNNPN